MHSDAKRRIDRKAELLPALKTGIYECVENETTTAGDVGHDDVAICLVVPVLRQTRS